MRAAKEEVWMWWQESVAWTERCLEWQRGLPKNVTFIIIIFLTVLSLHCGERASGCGAGLVAPQHVGSSSHDQD